MPKVAILGGGVAGMSAAHELIERGFTVDVYERNPIYVGGKARSVDVPDSATGERLPLPGEHGFRFFPGFYKHITDTMQRTPLRSGGTVIDNLAISERVMMARFGKQPIISLVNFPKSKKDLKVLFNALAHSDTGLTDKDVDTFAHKMWQLMTSCKERRQQEYERISWWQYMEADSHCPGEGLCPYEEYFVGGLTHTLVAAQPKLMSTKTGGDILLQLIFLMLSPNKHADRVLSAPTNDAWLKPWYDYLVGKGVNYYHHHEITGFDCDPTNRRIRKVMVKNLSTEEEIEVTADYYISAMPVEAMARVLNDDMVKADATLDYLHQLKKDTNWMNGIQYYLNEDVKLTRGHVIFLDSPWAVTAISQLQFWPDFDVSCYGNGEVKGILSVDVSDWFTKGLNGKMGCECTADEVVEEVWDQMERSLNKNGKVLDRSMRVTHSWLDDDIRKNLTGDRDEFMHLHELKNAEPLLVNQTNTWSLRPEAHCGIENLFLASDYVRTHTDLATMEGANEAARRAVNAIIIKSGQKLPLCKVWDLHEPFVLAPLRWLDRRRFRRGEPWNENIPLIDKILHLIAHWRHRLTKS